MVSLLNKTNVTTKLTAGIWIIINSHRSSTVNRKFDIYVRLRPLI